MAILRVAGSCVRLLEICSDSAYLAASLPLSAAFAAAGAPLAAAAAFAAAFGTGDLFPYHEEYSNELRNSFFSPQDLQQPSLTAPLGGSITQW